MCGCLKHMKIYFIKNRSQLKIVKLNMAQRITANKTKIGKEIKMHLAFTLKLPKITHSIAFSSFCMKMRQLVKHLN